MRRLSLLCFGLFCMACDDPQAKSSSSGIQVELKDAEASVLPRPAFPYDLAQPALEIELPEELEEISGLGFISPGLLACVEDERAAIYHIDLLTGQVAAKFPFGKDGDFEGVEILGTTAWALRSDGDLYETPNYTQGDSKTEKHENSLGKDNDVEGLGYDRKEHRLLLACKEDPGGNGEYKGTRSVYAFDIETKSLGVSPIYSIRVDEITDGRKDESFKPSGIAVHPLTGDIYVIASKGKRLAILSPAGELKRALKLSKKDFSQPEGICFSPSGDLFISNEADGGKSNILKFLYLGE